MIGTASRVLEQNFFGLKDFDKTLLSMLLELNNTCFDLPITVVRTTKTKGNKAKELLVAAGKNQKMSADFEFEIYEKVEEKVGNKTMLRENTIGKAKITSVSDENFCIMEVTSGDEEIMSALTNKSGVFAKLLID